jgi:kumamolisin
MNQYRSTTAARRRRHHAAAHRVAAGSRSPGFHDITLGGNAVDTATEGYDLVTGLGTPDVDNLPATS